MTHYIQLLPTIPYNMYLVQCDLVILPMVMLDVLYTKYVYDFAHSIKSKLWHNKSVWNSCIEYSCSPTTAPPPHFHYEMEGQYHMTMLIIMCIELEAQLTSSFITLNLFYLCTAKLFKFLQNKTLYASSINSNKLLWFSQVSL